MTPPPGLLPFWLVPICHAVASGSPMESCGLRSPALMRRTRRRILRESAGLFMIWLGLPLRARASITSESARRRRAEALVGTLFRPRSAAHVGRAYLCVHPEDASPERLLALLLPEAERTGDVSAGRDRARVRRMHQDDLTHVRVARVEGWILSRTEARVRARAGLLLSLLHI